MKKLKILMVTALVAAALATPAFANPGSPPKGKAPGYAVTNPNHTQRLGGRSERASRGLSRAAERSPSVNPSKSGTVVTPPSL